jgi:dTDP-L-rhamnose 4-epimerase
MSKRNILITGGAGFIGSNLALKLLDRGYSVTVLDNLSPQIHGNDPNQSTLYQSIKDRVNFIKGDITNRADLAKALEHQNVVVHLAAETGTGQSMYEIEKYTLVNIQGTSLLLDMLANQKNEIEKIVLSSSRAVYGEGKYLCTEHGVVYPLSRTNNDMSNGDFEVKCPVCGITVQSLPTDENSLQHPTSIYGITKHVQEQLIVTTGKALNIPTVVFRYQNVYGPGQSLSNPYTGILSIFSTRAKGGKDINIFEDGKESRDFVYIDDVTDATVLGIESERADYQVFNVGSGNPVDILTVVNTLFDKYGIKVPFSVSGNYRVGDIRNNYADLKKIRELLGFRPQVAFDEGIANFVNWVNGQEVMEDRYEKSLEEMKSRGLYK